MRSSPASGAGARPQIAKLHEVPVLEREIADREVLELALVENVQRQDLIALEEAEGYRRLIDEFGHSQEELARQVGKSRTHIANTAAAAQAARRPSRIAGGGHAHRRPRPRPARRRRSRWPWRNASSPLASRSARPRPWPPGLPSLPDRAAGGRRTPIPGRWSMIWAGSSGSRSPSSMGREAGEGGGSLTIRYQSLEQLDDVIRRLNRNN